MKEYKVISQLDESFASQFDAQKLEVLLNQLAAQGWRVATSTTTHIAGFAGTTDQVLIIMERDRAPKAAPPIA